jgi:hypothetical protein
MNKTMAGVTFAAVLASLSAGAYAQDAREEGPIEIDKCQTISQPGSYKLVKNLVLVAGTRDCLAISADFVTIDLAGFTISGPTSPSPPAGFSVSGTATNPPAQNSAIVARNFGIVTRNLAFPPT